MHRKNPKANNHHSTHHLYFTQSKNHCCLEELQKSVRCLVELKIPRISLQSKQVHVCSQIWLGKMSCTSAIKLPKDTT